VASKLFAALLVAVAACTPDVCARNSDCNGGLVCSSLGACEIAPPDAATSDGGSDALGDGGVDAAPDAAPDAVIDAAPDADSDAMPDGDILPDAGGDGEV
jgi:hypothetical protein